MPRMVNISSQSSRNPATCPVTGLAIERRPGWRIETDDGHFDEVIEVIGGRVLHLRPRGHARPEDVELVIALVRHVVTDGVADDRQYVHLADYRELKSTDAEGRRRFTEAMLASPRLVGIVFYGANSLLKIAIRLGRQLQLSSRPIEIVERYEQGIRVALDMLDGEDPASSSSGRGDPGSHHSASYRHLMLGDFELELEAVPPANLRSVVTGYLEEEHLDPVFQAMDEVAEALKPGFTIDVDVAGMRGISLAVRRRYVARLVEWHRRQAFASYTLHRANRLIRAAATISRPFVPFQLRVASVLKPGGRRTRWAWPRRRVTPRDIEALLEHFAGIDWNVPPTGDEAAVQGRDGPLGPVFDVVDLMTADVNRLLEERRLAEDALRQSEERYRTILDNIVDGFYEVDLEGNLVLCNDAFGRMLGFPRAELIGRSYRALVAPEDADRVFATFNQVFTTGEPTRAFNWGLVRQDGVRLTIEASVALRTAGDGSPVGFRGVVRDVSERAKAERDRAALEAQLRVAQRLESLGTLAGGIAHNFNNLLMGIQGNASLLRMEIEDHDPRSRRLDAITSLVDSGSRLTKQLLGYARAGRHEIVPVDIDAIVESTLETFAATRRDIRVHRALAGSLPAVEADPGQIEQVLMNLLVNAIDAMPAGGDLTVSTAVVPAEEVAASGIPPEARDHVVLAVRDTGIGMDSSTAERIFEPFFTTKGLHHGTGLGLASVYGIVTSHHGHVSVDSTLGVGTEFRVFLPVSDRPAHPIGMAPATTEKGKGVVLVVDDDPSVLEITTSMLAALGYEPEGVTNGHEAVAIASDAGRRIDLVVLDMVLPDLGGGAVFDALRELRPDLKVLLCSGYSLDGDAAGILARGCDAFIQKPFTLQRLAATVAGLLEPDAPRQ